jgi:hypothetical protein
MMSSCHFDYRSPYAEAKEGLDHNYGRLVVACLQSASGIKAKIMAQAETLMAEDSEL